MSLLDTMMEPFCIIEETRISDGAGGFNKTYTDGAEFSAALTLNSTMEARIAEKSGVTSVYTLTTKKNCILGYDVKFKRLSDGAKFRVTSDGSDIYSPNYGTLDIRQVSAEKWEATT